MFLLAAHLFHIAADGGGGVDHFTHDTAGKEKTPLIRNSVQKQFLHSPVDT